MLNDPAVSWVAAGIKMDDRLDLAIQDMDEGDVPPTRLAIDAFGRHVGAILLRARQLGFGVAGLPHLSLPGNGDISLEWVAGPRKFVAIYSPAGDVSLYGVATDPAAGPTVERLGFP